MGSEMCIRDSLTVDGIHTYFVGVAGEEALVHNICVGEVSERLQMGFDGAGPDELAQLARQHADVLNADRPSFEQVSSALDTEGVRLRAGIDGADSAVVFEANGVRVIINEAQPTRSTAHFID